MAYYAYTRVSTETQSEKGYGLETQREVISKYAKENKITIADWFEDAGISANIRDDDEDDAINKRQGLMSLLGVLKPNDTVIVMNTSRLWRSDMTRAIVRREIIKCNANVFSIEQPTYDIRYKNPSEYLINAIMEALDVYERMTIAMKLARGRATKAHYGDKPAGVCPYGYQYSHDKKSVIINPDEAEVVKMMFTMAQTGTSLQKIADELNNRRIPSRSGKPWKRGSIHAILHNRFYVGELTHGNDIIRGNHENIISKVQFGKVSAKLAKKKKAG